MSKQRKIYFINPPFQMKFIFFSILSSIIVVALTAIMQYIFFNHYHNMGVANGIPTDHIFFEFLKEQRNYITFAVVILGAVIVCIQIILGLLFSHRIAGPLYRLNKHFQDVAAGGENKPIRLREGDYFTELADNFNAMMEKLDQKK